MHLLIVLLFLSVPLISGLPSVSPDTGAGSQAVERRQEPVPVPLGRTDLGTRDDMQSYQSTECQVGLWNGVDENRNSVYGEYNTEWQGLPFEGVPENECINVEDLNPGLVRTIRSFAVTGYCECEFFKDKDCLLENGKFSAYNRKDGALYKSDNDNILGSFKCRKTNNWEKFQNCSLASYPDDTKTGLGLTLEQKYFDPITGKTACAPLGMLSPFKKLKVKSCSCLFFPNTACDGAVDNIDPIREKPPVVDDIIRVGNNGTVTFRDIPTDKVMQSFTCYLPFELMPALQPRSIEHADGPRIQKRRLPPGRSVPDASWWGHYDTRDCRLGVWEDVEFNHNSPQDHVNWQGMPLGLEPHDMSQPNGYENNCVNMGMLHERLKKSVSSFVVAGYCECEFYDTENCPPEAGIFTGYNRADSSLAQHGNNDNIDSFRCWQTNHFDQFNNCTIAFSDGRDKNLDVTLFKPDFDRDSAFAACVSLPEQDELRQVKINGCSCTFYNSGDCSGANFPAGNGGTVEKLTDRPIGSYRCELPYGYF
ncbi:hypothetical protein H072_7658 [Dactylellina haptotyla CBS 200.50]|uniref:Uncharacterized protein n=1 Tax=Dactylellina haptotyla (strain CBS 200.50) TaxID=1284197 RepID=S8A6B4_DACHA|nr:hypothetical protein H072_7658 [Dactylellina haptotyla CBS 200.50]